MTCNSYDVNAINCPQKKAAVAAGLNLFKINNAEVRDGDPQGVRTMPQLEGASLLRALSKQLWPCAFSDQIENVG